MCVDPRIAKYRLTADTRRPLPPMRTNSKVTTSVSSKTSYVVLGADAGPKKLDMIKKNKIKTLDEDGFLNLIATRCVTVAMPDRKVSLCADSRWYLNSGAKDLDHKYLEKQKEEEKKIREAAKSIAVDPACVVACFSESRPRS